MEEKVERLTKSVEELKRQLQTIQAKIESQNSILDKIGKDVGTSDSKVLSDVIYRTDVNAGKSAADIQTILREAIETRRMATNIELMAKEIMKGLSVIYNSVDELEENLLPERLTK